jgi:hypothetical protein
VAGGEAEDSGSSVNNHVSAHSITEVIQAGTVHGGLHIHRRAFASVIPRQLPSPPRPFVGRANYLAALDRMLSMNCATTQDVDTADAAAAQTVSISVVGGVGGIGKTWLVLHWAHLHLRSFPDGQLFVDLRGFSPDSDPLAPAVAIRGFLDALGVGPEQVPVAPAAQAALFRSLVTDRRMLIVLDNAASTDQVVPLLPGGDSCTVVVTSRRILTALITRNGAQHVNVDSLTEHEAHALLTRRLGHGPGKVVGAGQGLM